MALRFRRPLIRPLLKKRGGGAWNTRRTGRGPLDTVFPIRQNVTIMSDDPFPYSVIQRMEREHGFKVMEVDVDAVVGIVKKICREQGHAFDRDALAGFILFVATKRAVVMSIPRMIGSGS